MKFTAIVLVVLCSGAIAAPIPQGAGVGAGCNSILTDADTGSGLFGKEALQNTASLLKSAGVKRQGAGVGAGCDSILTDADTGSGLLGKEALQNAASLIKSAGGKRQLDKLGAGTASIISLVNPELAGVQEGATNSLDGAGTSDSADIGQRIGQIEVEAGTAAGNLVPSKLPAGKRQLDKLGAGTASVLDLVSPQAAAYQEGVTNTLDGDGTSDSAIIGQQIGDLEVQTLTGAGNLVPSKIPATNVPAAKAPKL